MVVSVPAGQAADMVRRPVPWDGPGVYETYEEWRAREEAKRRHPAGRALTGLFRQTYPWLAPPEPARPVERSEPVAPGAALGRYAALEGRVAELEARLARLEGGSVVDASAGGPGLVAGGPGLAGSRS
ncbi:hypothetical protein [Nonomuraea candida]|uniref:hypothetical protein n=1 Tax=Nonomuraea candida TaxID=359159 RepID=UPI0005BB20A4|nr:hypothetical protein [Nonomuraea candida]